MKCSVLVALCWFGANLLCSVAAAKLIEGEVVCKVPNLESLNVEKLFEVAVENKACRKAANEVFMSKFGQFPIVISDVNSPDMLKHGEIYVNNVRADNFLKVFQESVKKVTVDFRQLNSHKQVAKSINVYGSDSLEAIKIVSLEEQSLIEMVDPFKKLTSFDYVPRANDPDHIGNNFIFLFPELRRLQIKSQDHAYFRLSYFEEHFPKLEEIDVDSSNSAHLSPVLRKNPQITKLSIVANEYVMKDVQDLVKNLEVFSLKWEVALDLYKGPSFVFNDVHTLKITELKPFVAEKLVCKNLTSLEIEPKDTLDEWMKFIEQNKNVQNLTLLAGALSESALEHISKHLTNLTEAAFFIHEKMPVLSVSKFIYSAERLNKLTLDSPNSQLYSQLHSEHGQHWRIVVKGRSIVMYNLHKSAATHIFSMQTTVAVLALALVINAHHFLF